MAARDDFKAATIRRLAERAGYRCSNPHCGAATIGPDAGGDGVVRTGRASHITAAARTGPRYTTSLTPDQRQSIDNGIWLCAACADRVDRDTDYHTVTVLGQWKRLRESQARQALAKPAVKHFAVLEVVLSGHTNYVWDVVAHPDGQQALSASNDATVMLWDIGTQRPRHVYRGATSEVRSVSCSTDGSIVAGGCVDGRILTWTLLKSDPSWFDAHGAPDAKVLLLDTGDLLSGGSDGLVKVWHAGVRTEVVNAHSAPILKLAQISPNRVATVSEDCTAKVWSLADWSTICSCEGHAGGVNSVAIAPSGSLIVTGSDDCTIRLWNPLTGECERTLEGHCETVWRVAVDPAERAIASGSGDNTVRLWQMTGTVIDEIPHPDCVAAVTFSPEGDRLIVGCDDNQLYVYGLPWADLSTLREDGARQ